VFQACDDSIFACGVGVFQFILKEIDFELNEISQKAAAIL